MTTYTIEAPQPLTPSALAEGLRELADHIEVGRFPLGSRWVPSQALAVTLPLASAEAVHELAREYGYDAADSEDGHTYLELAFGTGTGMPEAYLPCYRGAVVVRASHVQESS